MKKIKKSAVVFFLTVMFLSLSHGRCIFAAEPTVQPYVPPTQTNVPTERPYVPPAETNVPTVRPYVPPTSTSSSSSTSNDSSSATVGIVYPTTAETGLPDNSVKGTLENILKWILGIMGVLGVLGFVVSGVQYIIATGDPKEAEKAKKTMINSAIGIIVALLGLVAVVTIDFVLRG